MSPRVVIWAGHGPKEPGHEDPGVCSPERDCEADWTTDLAAMAAAELRGLGVLVEDLVLGPYAQRAALADAAGAALVVHLHGDTGAPSCYYYPRSTRGALAAQAIQAQLAPVLPWALQLREAGAAFPRAKGLLAMTRAPAVLVELVQQVSPVAVQQLRERQQAIARALALGIQAALS